MDIKYKSQYKISKRNTVMSYNLGLSNVNYNRAKLISIISAESNFFYPKLNRVDFVRDVEQTLIDYDITDSKFFEAIWASISKLPLSKRDKIFGRRVLQLSMSFRKDDLFIKIHREDIKPITDSDMITLQIIKEIALLNYAINVVDYNLFNSIVKRYDIFKKAFRNDGLVEHKKLWRYLDFICINVGDLDTLFYFT